MTFHSTMCLFKNFHESTTGWNLISNGKNISGKNFLDLMSLFCRLWIINIITMLHTPCFTAV